MVDRKKVYLIGYASGIAGAHPESGEGPLVLQKSPYFSHLQFQPCWYALVASEPQTLSKLEWVVQQTQKLAKLTENLVKNKKFFITVGGDHTCAIGTWSGVESAMSQQGPVGLIWIDAHMDSHTPQTTHTGNFHGMPLACLLGFGDKQLTHLLNPVAKIKPEHLCLIGVRSYEAEEAELLKRLNVRVFFMEEVQRRGMAAVMQDALHIVTQHTAGFGVSLDIDSIDPNDAPGTGVPAPAGIPANDLCQALSILSQDKRLIGAEITEFDPHQDKDHMTEKLILRLMTAITMG